MMPLVSWKLCRTHAAWLHRHGDSVSAICHRVTSWHGRVAIHEWLVMSHGGVILKTPTMAKPPRPDPKVRALQEHGCLNKQPDKVKDPLFCEDGFFDPRDVVQVKYEMLRRVKADQRSVSEAAASFGLSRPSFYVARDSFTQHGLEGLVPKKRGPRGRHKLTEEVVRFIKQARANDDSLGGRRLAKLVQQHLRISIDARTIERGVPRREKKRP